LSDAYRKTAFRIITFERVEGLKKASLCFLEGKLAAIVIEPDSRGKIPAADLTKVYVDVVFDPTQVQEGFYVLVAPSVSLKSFVIASVMWSVSDLRSHGHGHAYPGEVRQLTLSSPRLLSEDARRTKAVDSLLK
jgi:hypothetical protein